MCTCVLCLSNLAGCIPACSSALVCRAPTWAELLLVRLLFSPRGALREDFEIFGVTFDTKMSMHKEIFKLSCEVSKEMRALVKVRKFCGIYALISLYKARVLPCAERSTPAFSHIHPNNLLCFDYVQVIFLEDLGVSCKEPLTVFNLALLRTRRNMSMLGLLHRTQLGEALSSIMCVSQALCLKRLCVWLSRPRVACSVLCCSVFCALAFVGLRSLLSLSLIALSFAPHTVTFVPGGARFTVVC